MRGEREAIGLANVKLFVSVGETQGPESGRGRRRDPRSGTAAFHTVQGTDKPIESSEGRYRDHRAWWASFAHDAETQWFRSGGDVVRKCKSRRQNTN
jgi:hypothetical protein